MADAEVKTLGGVFNESGAVFNQSNANVDFRVEGDTLDDVLFVDGGTERVGVKTDTPVLQLDVSGQILRTAGRGNTTHRIPGGGYNPRGEEVFSIDPQMSNAELHAFVNSNQAAASVTWDTTASDAPGGAAIKIIGAQTLAGRNGAGFPFIPIEDQEGQGSGHGTATYYGEIWIKNVGNPTVSHYVGASDFDGDFGTPDATQQSGNPGTYGYWVRYGGSSDDSSWTKYSGYVSGYHGTDIGTFETGASFFSPLGTFNYNEGTYAEGETNYCLISGWKIWKVTRSHGIKVSSGTGPNDGYGFGSTGNYFAGIQYGNGQTGPATIRINSSDSVDINLDTNSNDPNGQLPY